MWISLLDALSPEVENRGHSIPSVRIRNPQADIKWNPWTIPLQRGAESCCAQGKAGLGENPGLDARGELVELIGHFVCHQ